MLPDTPGTEVCRRLRADPELADTAILMLTARGDEYDRVLGFEVGADDYVVKPFSVRELVMRVRGMARRYHERRAARSTAPAEKKLLQWKGLSIDPARHRVFSDGGELSLRPLEFKLLAMLLEHPGASSRAAISSRRCGASPARSTRGPSTPTCAASASASARTARPSRRCTASGTASAK